MIGLINRDSSYFKLSADSIKQSMSIMTQQVIRFSLTEETGKLLSGSLSIYDPTDYYGNILRMGKPINIEFGYKKNPVFFSTFKEDKDQTTGAFNRTGIRAIIQSPSGSASDKGVKVYNCNFIGREYSAGIYNKVFRTGTKATVISEVMSLLVISKKNQYISFPRGKERITEDTYVMQYESHVNFLRRLSFEWGALFELATTPSGERVGLFATMDSLSQKNYAKLKSQAERGSFMTFNYMYKKGENACLVKSYDWSQSGGGAGDNVQIVMVAGQPQFIRYNAATESTIVYKFKPEKVRAMLKTQPNLAARSDLLKDWLAINEFETLVKKGFFVASTETTAPQGLGFKITCKILGNTMATSSMRAIFEDQSEKKNSLGGLDKIFTNETAEGFPDVFKNKNYKFWIRKVTHEITQQGYQGDVEIVDMFTASGGSYVA